MTKEQLAQRRLELIADLKSAGEWQRDEIIAELRNVNAAIKQFNIEESRAAKSEADKRKARGMAEHFANLQRAGVAAQASPLPAHASPLPAHARQGKPLQAPGEQVLWLAKRLRAKLCRLKAQAPHTLTFLPLLTEFIDAQEAMLVGDDAKPSSPDELTKIWDEPWIDPGSDKL